jgi:hypothetical protein
LIVILFFVDFRDLDNVMESIEEFVRIDVINGGLLIGEDDTFGSVEIGGGGFFGFFGGSFDMGVGVEVGWDWS